MTNPNGVKGRDFENACVTVLRALRWPHAERRRTEGVNDRGDIAGMNGPTGAVVVECKNHGRIDLPGWLSELDREIVSARASTGFVWIKRRGKSSALDGYAVMRPADLLALLDAAGYAHRPPNG